MKKTADRQKGSLIGKSAGAALEAALCSFCRKTAAHTPIMSERQLAAKYRVSPGTVRRTVCKLVSEGVMYSKPRSGTYVAENTEKTSGTVIYADTWGELEHPFYRQQLRGLLSEALALGLKLEVLDCGSQMSARERLYEDAGRPEILGVILPWCNLGIQKNLLRANPDLRIIATVSQRTPPGVSFAGIDYTGLGSHAAYYLIPRANKSGNTLLGIMTQEASAAGFRENCLAQGKIPEIIMIPETGRTPAAIAAGIRDISLDGIAFDDDLLAADVLHYLGPPGIPVISLANKNTDFLPPYVARLEIDGEALGHLVMRFMQPENKDRIDDAALLLRPKLKKARLATVPEIISELTESLR